MSDNLRRYRAIRAALLQGYPGQPTGTIARHLTTLAALMSGIVGSNTHGGESRIIFMGRAFANRPILGLFL